MRVFINATSATLGGGVTVLRRLLPALLDNDGGTHEYTIAARPEARVMFDPRSDRVRFIELPADGNGTKRASIEQVLLPLRLATGDWDLLLSPANQAILLSPIPQLLIFRNVAPFTPHVLALYRWTRDAIRLRALRRMGILSARAADKVIFISDAQRDQILPSLKVPSARTRRIYLGRAPDFNPNAKRNAPELLAKLGIAEPYILSVSHFYRYQNIVELIQGFALAAPDLPSTTRLVLAGAEVDKEYAVQVKTAVARSEISNRIIFTGNIAYKELPALYAAASLFVFSTTCESFPNTLVEAMASGAPTLASDVGPMPELGGAGAEYFDANSPAEISRKIRQLWADEGRRRALSSAGIARSKQFSWQTTAMQLLEVMAEAVANSPKGFSRVSRILHPD